MERSHLHRLIRTPAVRRFDPDRPVPDETITGIVDAARWTGSARNRQPWLVLRARSERTRRELSELGAYAAFVADAPVLLVIAAADNGFSDTLFDCGRLTQSLLLAAQDAGLRGCPATIFPDANVARATALLGLEEGWLPRHLLALGHPAPRERGRLAVPRGRRALDVMFRDEAGS